MGNILEDQAHTIARNNIMGYEGLVRYIWKNGKNPTISTAPYNKSEISSFPVYDDSNSSNVWLPGSSTTYDDWRKTVKGHPTLGYGMRYDLLSPELQREYIQSNGNIGIDWISRSLDSKINSTMKPVMKRHPEIAELKPEQQGALASFYYNLGSSPRGKETMERALSTNNVQGIYDAFPLYVKAGGRVLPGLVRRRQQERTAFAPQTPTPAPQTPKLAPAPAPQVTNADTGYVSVRRGDSLWKWWRQRENKSESWGAFQNRVKADNPKIDFNKPLSLGTKIKLKGR